MSHFEFVSLFIGAILVAICCWIAFRKGQASRPQLPSQPSPLSTENTANIEPGMRNAMSDFEEARKAAREKFEAVRHAAYIGPEPHTGGDLVTDAFLSKLRESGFVIVPKDLMEKITDRATKGLEYWYSDNDTGSPRDRQFYLEWKADIEAVRGVLSASQKD